MKTDLKALLTSFILVLSSNTYAFDYASYKETTLSNIFKERSEDECRKTEDNESIYSAYAHKYRFKTKFTRKLREIGKDKMLYLERHGKAMRWNQEVLKLYKHEFLVLNDGNEYWLPIQEQLLPHMGSELKVGDDFEVYAAVLGSTHNECIFIVTEFKSGT